MAARMAAEHEPKRRGLTDVLRSHDLVGPWILDDAVLVDARFVGEGVPTDDRFVRLDRLAGEPGEQLAGLVQGWAVHAGVEGQRIAADAERHHELLERGVPGALADAVN